MKNSKVSLLLLCSILAIQLEASFDNPRYRFAQPIQAESSKAITEINIPKYNEYQELDAEQRGIIGISSLEDFDMQKMALLAIENLCIEMRDEIGPGLIKEVSHIIDEVIRGVDLDLLTCNISYYIEIIKYCSQTIKNILDTLNLSVDEKINLANKVIRKYL